MNRIFLIDGHAQIFRMYYAFMRHPLINSKGVDTSILYGLTKMVLELINKEHPTHIAVAFDLHADTFRHKVYPKYKANRPPAPELVINSLEPLKEILKALSIPYFGIEGYEADDIIGSMAKQWSSNTAQVYMVTPDKDYGQLIDDNIFQYKFPKGAATEPDIVTKKKICAYYGISSPESVIDILTIWGDPADNIPGVKGIGEVGAKKLIGKYENIDNLLLHINELPAKQRDSINEARTQLEQGRFLITIKTDINLGISLDDIKISAPQKQAIDEVFGIYEFASLKKMIGTYSEKESPLTSNAAKYFPIDDYPADDYPADDYPADDYPIDSSENNPIKPIVGIPSVQMVSFDQVKNLASANKEVAIKILNPNEGSVILAAVNNNSTLQQPSGIAVCTKITEPVADFLIDPSITKTGVGLKEIIRLIATETQHNEDSTKVAEKFRDSDLYDIELIHYLINPEINHSSQFIIKQYFHTDLSEIAPAQPESNIQEADLFSEADKDNSQQEKIAAHECILYIYLKDKLLAEVAKMHGNLYTQIEMPLISTLAAMEVAGVKINTQQLKEYSQTLTAQVNSIEAKAKELAADTNINLSSPLQVGNLLFGKLKLGADIKKNVKGRYPTDEQTLKSISATHPIVKDILEYRNLKKLLSTYIDALPQMIDNRDKKIHTTFNQALTATGRLSSNNPNLQNIPIRTERGREIRKAFVPSFENGFIVSADYSQIELRLMAHLSADKHLIEAFNSGQDIHRATAARLFGVDIKEVTEEQRRKAKTVNFGIIYGISSFGLAERMDIGVREAKVFIENYFKMYPSVSTYIENIIEQAHQKGYVETLYGRRRYLRDINSKNTNVRKFNERNAVNAPLQGSAADIIKIAMSNVAKRMASEHLASRMILQVHDELVFDVTQHEKDIVMQIAKQEMESVVKLSINLIAECGYGKNWLEAH